MHKVRSLNDFQCYSLEYNENDLHCNLTEVVKNENC